MKTVVSLAVINNTEHKHLVVYRACENNYGLPGGKINKNENPKIALVRELKEETGLIIKAEDLELINIQNLTQEGKEVQIFTFGCVHLISSAAPLFTAETKVVPMFMEPKKFYSLTSFKEYYENLFTKE